MTLTGSLYAGISGLTVHSQSITVVSNNLANVSTIGFKGSTMQFEDAFYDAVTTANGFGQVGYGASVASIYGDFSQGAYEPSSEATDVAIGGDGFFIVSDPNTNTDYYTRAGNFRFNEDGYLINPQGYRVQGWAADPSSTGGVTQTMGSLGDIKLEDFQSPPQGTSSMTMLANLDKDADDNSTNAANPFFAMLEGWDGQADPPIGDSDYAYQMTMQVYDEGGTAHDVTVYFDPVKDSAATSGAGSNQVWEYMVTCDPSEDGRTIDGQDLSTTSAAGILMAGTLTFDSSGQLLGQSAFTLPSTATGDLKDLTNWEPAELSKEGVPTFTANWSGDPGGNGTDQPDAKAVELNFGLSNSNTALDWEAGTMANAAAVGSSYANLTTFAEVDQSANTMTNYSSSNTTYELQQDGYPTGYLQGISVNSDGIVTGTFSNGQISELFVLGLADFDNQNGLTMMGGSLFAESGESGAAHTGRANTSGLGSISSNTLEQSNVDMAEEMVRLITLQSGYQANSKVIQTTDTLLQTTINLKR